MLMSTHLVFSRVMTQVWWVGTNNNDEQLVLFYRAATFPLSS